MSRSEKSAEAVVAAGMERRAERVEVHEGVPMSRAMRQMPERSGRDGVVIGYGNSAPQIDVTGTVVGRGQARGRLRGRASVQ